MKKKNQSLIAVKSVFIFSVIAVVGFMTTQALFIDRETSGENQFVVGTLDMTVSGESSVQADTVTVQGIGAQHITNGGKRWNIKNVGSLPGELHFAVSNIRNLENGCNEPEALVDTSCADPGENQGELGQHITATVGLRNGATSNQLFTHTLATQDSSVFTRLWQEKAGTIIIPPGESKLLELSWSVTESHFENEVQSDSVTFATTFQLKQVVPGATSSPNQN